MCVCVRARMCGYVLAGASVASVCTCARQHAHTNLHMSAIAHAWWQIPCYCAGMGAAVDVSFTFGIGPLIKGYSQMMHRPFTMVESSKLHAGIFTSYLPDLPEWLKGRYRLQPILENTQASAALCVVGLGRQGWRIVEVCDFNALLKDSGTLVDAIGGSQEVSVFVCTAFVQASFSVCTDHVILWIILCHLTTSPAGLVLYVPLGCPIADEGLIQKDMQLHPQADTCNLVCRK